MADFAPTAERFDKPVFAVWCEDGPEAECLRSEHLEGHLHHVERHHEHYIVAGPMRPTDEMKNTGSFFLIIADDEEHAWEITRGDPYFDSGMYASIEMRSFTPAVGRFLGGVIWDSVESVRAFATQGRPAGQTK